MKNIILVTGFCLLSTSVFASDDIELTEAPSSFVEEALMMCNEFAQDEDIKAEELDAFLLECVNDELEESDYKKLAKLPE